MIDGKRVLGLIPARGGSKGIPRKNVRSLGGKPLIAWTIEQGKESRYIDRLVVSTDDRQIADVAREWGADVPFLRPDDLATDDARGVDVVIHALQELPEFDVVVLLQPTSPFRVTGDIDAAIALWKDNESSSVVGVTEVAKSPYWMYRIRDDGALTELLPKPASAANRQQLPKTYALNGAVYVTTAASLLELESFLSPSARPYVMPSDRSVDLDSQLDWLYAEWLIGRHHAPDANS